MAMFTFLKRVEKLLEYIVCNDANSGYTYGTVIAYETKNLIQIREILISQ